MPEVGKEDLDATKDESPEEAAPPTSMFPASLAPEVEAAFRKIAKEEIGKALGHTIV